MSIVNIKGSWKHGLFFLCIFRTQESIKRGIFLFVKNPGGVFPENTLKGFAMLYEIGMTFLRIRAIFLGILVGTKVLGPFIFKSLRGYQDERK